MLYVVDMGLRIDRQACRPIYKKTLNLHKMLVATDVKKLQRKLASFMFWPLGKIANAFQMHEIHYDVKHEPCVLTSTATRSRPK